MMKKSTLIALALCLVVGGIGISVAGIALGGKTSLSWDQSGLRFNSWDENPIEYDISYKSSNKRVFDGMIEELNDFSKMDITSGTVDVTVKEGEDYSICIDVGSKVDLNYGVRGDTLYIEQEGHRTGWNFISPNARKDYSGKIIVTVPQDKKLEKANVMLGVGEGLFENIETEKFSLMAGVSSTNIQGLTADYVTIEGGVGELNLEGSNLGEAKITMGVGRVKLETALTGDMDIEGGIGELDIILDGEEQDFNYEISRGGGSIKINDQRYSGMGYVEVRNKSNQTIEIEAGLGSINIETN
ncbi:MAG: DUF4097 family beta strand repeat-containing protein [Niameybacter sp.]